MLLKVFYTNIIDVSRRKWFSTKKMNRIVNLRLPISASGMVTVKDEVRRTDIFRSRARDSMSHYVGLSVWNHFVFYRFIILFDLSWCTEESLSTFLRFLYIAETSICFWVFCIFYEILLRGYATYGCWLFKYLFVYFFPPLTKHLFNVPLSES